MKVLVVNAPARASVYGGLAGMAAVEIPVWAGLIAEYLERRGRGYEVEVLDCEAEGWDVERSAREVRGRGSDLAVFPVYGQQPSASTQCLPAAEAVARDCGTRTIALGTHCSALPARTIAEGPWTYVAKGEGFATVAGLLDVLEGMGRLEDVPGLFWRDGLGGGGFRGNLPAPNIADLDSLAPSRGFGRFDFKRYRAHNWHAFGRDRSPYASLQTSLGCPFKCTFCCINAPFGGAGIRYWSVENIGKHIEQLVDAGVENIKFPDEMLCLNKQHVIGICDEIDKRGFGNLLNMWAYARVDTVKDGEMLERMRRSGFRWLGIGVESGSKHVRDGVDKGKFGDDDIRKAIERVRASGIHIAANYIFGLPDDTAESMQETLDLACEVNSEWANFYSCMAYPGSQLHKIAQVKGWRLPEDEDGPGWIGYSQHSYDALPLPTETLSPEEVLDFRDEAFIAYFRRPEYLRMIDNKFGLQAKLEVKEMLSFGKPRRRHRVEQCV